MTNHGYHQSTKHKKRPVFRPFLSMMMAFGFAACSETVNPPVPLLSEPVFEQMFVELRMISQFTEATGDTLTASQLADSLWQANAITPAQYLENLDWYTRDIPRHKKRLERMADSLSALDIRISQIR